MERTLQQRPALTDVAEGASHPGGARHFWWLMIVGLAAILFTMLVGVVLSWMVIRSGAAGASPSQQPSLPSQGLAPDFELTNQDGQKVKLSDFRGRVVLMTFFYANCTAICPTMNLDLQQAHRSLAPAAQKQLVLLSISFDPKTDTPEKLKAYARERGFNQPGWHFLTGTPEDVAQLLQAYGIVAQESGPQVHIHADGTEHPHQGEFSHMAQALLIDQQGEVRGAYLGVATDSQVFSVRDVVRDIQALLRSHKG